MRGWHGPRVNPGADSRTTGSRGGWAVVRHVGQRVGPHLHQLLVQVSLVEADVDGITSGHHVVVVDHLQSEKD